MCLDKRGLVVPFCRSRAVGKMDQGRCSDEWTIQPVGQLS